MDRLLSPKALSELWGIPEKTLADWRSRGIGPAYKSLGRHVRYAPADLERYLEGRGQQPRSA